MHRVRGLQALALLTALPRYRHFWRKLMRITWVIKASTCSCSYSSCSSSSSFSDQLHCWRSETMDDDHTDQFTPLLSFTRFLDRTLRCWSPVQSLVSFFQVFHVLSPLQHDHEVLTSRGSVLCALTMCPKFVDLGFFICLFVKEMRFCGWIYEMF